MTVYSAHFLFASGVTAKSFFPGGFLDSVGGTDVWLAGGTIVSITCSAEALAGVGFRYHIYDNKSSAYLNDVRPSGNQLQMRAVTNPTVVHPSSAGGMDVIADEGIASYNTNNRLAIVQCYTGETRTYQVNVPNILGMVVVLEAGAATTKAHSLTVNYIPTKLGGTRKRFWETYRTVVNAGSAWS